MPSTTKSHKLKRKRGKKFVWHGNQEEKTAAAPTENPFETHSKAKTAAKDLEKREGLIDEYRRLGKNSSIVDNRLAEKSSKLSEDDKMKLRFMAEQRDRAKLSLTRQAKKRAKFHLDSDSDGEVYMGFTHKGKTLQGDDDFKEHIHQSSDEEVGGNGKLNEEMVDRLNFGGGDQAAEPVERKKSRKEVFEEIIEKSKAFNAAKQEMKTLNTELVHELDQEYDDLVGKLDFSRKKDALSSNPTVAQSEVKGKDFDKFAASLKEDLRAKAQPVKQVLTANEEAKAKKKRLQELETEDAPKKREQKLLDKREIAIQKILDEQAKQKRQADRINAVADGGKGKKGDKDLESESDQSESEGSMVSEEGEMEMEEGEADLEGDYGSEANFMARRVADDSDNLGSESGEFEMEESGECSMLDSAEEGEDSFEERHGVPRFEEVSEASAEAKKPKRK